MTKTIDWIAIKPYLLENIDKLSLAEMSDKVGISRQRIHQKLQHWGLVKPYPQRQNVKKFEGVFKLQDSTNSSPYDVEGVILFDINTKELKFYGTKV